MLDIVLRDRRRRALIALFLTLLVGVGTVTAPVALAVPGEGVECESESAIPGQPDPCRPEADLGWLVPLAGGLAVGVVLALGGAYLFLRRRAGPPMEAPDSIDWWTCASCGRSNMVGSPRCHACGTWQR